ncbi:MAG: hypothetical protein KAJ95_00655 [Gammaproteobacteria bacterium]|nr:hypothetical protein [Gammaproteobacteria bacterium]
MTNTKGSNIYTCPVHPEIIQDHPGSCLKSGIALEPKTDVAEEKNEALNGMTRRLREGE